MKRKNIEKKMKKFFWPSRDLNPWPSRSVRQQIFDQVLPQNGIILTAYEVKLNHQYLSIFSVDFCFFGHCSFSIPHRSQKDPLCALAYFLAYFSRFSAVWGKYVSILSTYWHILLKLQTVRLIGHISCTTSFNT